MLLAVEDAPSCLLLHLALGPHQLRLPTGSSRCGDDSPHVRSGVGAVFSSSGRQVGMPATLYRDASSVLVSHLAAPPPMSSSGHHRVQQPPLLAAAGASLRRRRCSSHGVQQPKSRNKAAEIRSRRERANEESEREEGKGAGRREKETGTSPLWPRRPPTLPCSCCCSSCDPRRPPRRQVAGRPIRGRAERPAASGSVHKAQ